VKSRSIEYVLEEAFIGIKRNGVMAVASISTIALSLGILGAFLLAAMSANRFTEAQIDRFEIAVFVKSSSASTVDSIVKRIEAMKGVEGITVRSRDEEWAAFKRSHPDIENAGLPLNPLPYALDVKVNDADRTSVIASKIRTIQGVDAVREGRETLQRVLSVARVLKVLSYAGVLILFMTTAFIIGNAIRMTLYARRREIRIMQLVGATNEFIRVPLVIEGVAFGAAGAIIAFALLRACSSYFGHLAQSITPILGRFSSGVGVADMALGMIGLGVAIGAVGSVLSIRRFLHD